ncbi:MAG: dissimilatory sulfite reductase D family protein [Anaerolineae bacterium]
MAGEVTEELKAQIVEFFKKKDRKMTTRDVAKGMGLDHKLVKDAIRELVNAGTLEFTSFGGATFIQIPK